ncbi:glycosyltransferase family 4 protein [Candidatus Roizmanbacteria bacterium CG_4_9_14_3_um_filter_33_18]|uniref:Glycosyltransferase family 4 protein n=2 Tax=Candidatus Roizmaniibacteriota TaxID=1752723 RepID=A0A2M7XX64_9BACT|nr:MAG: glycosyl transferase [Candidatus Roizmanbacteria bacterium CG22_combo_CG10-13_8_21_14_all_34_12]PJA55322.1 MAG: glycosyltransferase family 4 protein [Candidatus Roizmanbacteria bacterium CG_4_9_14_3_um_filter_33_18]
MLYQKKIAIVYDWIDKWGGVERVLLNLHEMFPEAVFYTSYFDEIKAEWAKDLNIKTSFLQKFPDFIKKSRILSFIFYPFAFESFDFSGYDLVISITSSFAKSIITKPRTKHICYLLTPTRYLWSHKQDYIKNNLINYLISGYLDMFKNWDLVVSQRPDKIISISETVRERCKKYYKRDSEVVYPGFDVEYWKGIKSEIRNPKFETNSKFKILNSKFFLVISRLEPYKRVDLAIKVFNRLNKQLVIIGEGSKEKKLKQIAGKNITFLSKLSDVELGSFYSSAQALIMPQEEDFGYVSLEAQLFGCPVLAYKKGGVLETIIENKTGIFFDNQDERSLSQAIERFNKIEYNLKSEAREIGLSNVEKFSKEKFINKFIKLIMST